MSKEKDKKGGKRAAAGGGGGKEKPKYTGKELILRRAYLVLTIIAAIIVVAYVAWRLFSAPPNVDQPKGPDSVGLTRPPQVTTTVDPETGETIEIEIPGLSSDRKEQFYTFLMVGQSQDAGGKLSDTMMLAAYDVPNQKLSVMSLPRDTYVNYGGRTQLLNAVYNAAGGDKDGKGIEGLKKAVRDLTGVYPDFHVIIQWEALGELVDAIGGVYFDVPFNMYYNDLSQHFKIDVKKGYQLLDGEGAMGVVRWRQNSIGDTGRKDDHYGYAEGDLGRIKTQQAFLKEVIKKCLQPDVLLKNLTEYISIFQKNVNTDLTVGEMAYFAQAAVGGLDMEGVQFVTLPNGSAGNGHLLPNGSQIVTTVNEGFNPYKEDIRRNELRLATMDNVPRTSKAPEESGEPDETEDPEESQGPDESRDPETSGSPRPTESGSPGGDEPLLPPGVSAPPRPSQSAAPSGRPSGSPAPSSSAAPTSSATPSGRPSAAPEETETSGGGTESEEPGTSAGESEAAPTPVPTTDAPPPPADDEPLLPPGV